MASGPRVDLLSQSALDCESFRIYCYKVVPCAKKFGHDWSECPFAHEGEKATRRCPALYRYSSIVCPDTRQGKACPRGDVCPYSHSVFEYWMHPARFRAQLCSFGTDCNRRICFFAHTQDQLRIPSEPVVADALASRAPYLQGRVAPESRYALYPEQVPSLVPAAGRMIAAPQQTLVGQDMPGGMQGIPQVVYMTGGAPQAVALAGQAAALPSGQPWAPAAAGGSSNIMIMPAGQPAAAPAGMGYYVQTGAAAPGAGGQDLSTGMIVAAPGMQVLGGSYAGGQAVQLMAVPGDGSGMAPYPMGTGAMAGAQVAYAPLYPSGGVMVQQWAPADQQQQQQHSQRQQQPQQQPQLLQGMQPQRQQQQDPQARLQLVVPEDAAAAAAHAPRQDAGAYILAPSGQMGPSSSQLQGPYTMLPAGVVQGGAGLMQQPGARSSVTGGAQGAVESAGPAVVDDLAQQMAGWGIQ